MVRRNKKGYLNYKWLIYISILSFFITIFLSYISEIFLKNTGLFFAFITLLMIILFGIIFDIIGVAVAASEEKPFHSMASNKVPGAKYSIQLIRNASIVTSICNDVIGDISNILAGVSSVIIIIRLADFFPELNGALFGTVFSGIIASITIIGKALGKSFALRHNVFVVSKTGYILYFLSKFLHIDFIFNNNRKKNKIRK